MKVYDLEQNSQEWLDARKGKITGSKLRGIIVKRGTKRKIGFYELMAEHVAMDGIEDDPRERGHALEPLAIAEFEKAAGKVVEPGRFCVSDFNDNIALSPDGLIKNGEDYTEAVEVKCLGAAKHLQAYFEKEIPNEYTEQAVQYFIVNEKLETLYFCFYDPRVTPLRFHYLEIKREDVASLVEKYREYQESTLQEIEDMLNQLF